MDAIEQQFRELAAEADAFWQQSGRDLYEIEPHLSRIVEFVKSHPEHRGMFARVLGELVEDVDYVSNARGRKTSLWIVAYSMRELRWPEVREAVEARQRRELDPSIRDRFLRWILRAYEPKWDFDIYFHRYGRSDREKEADAEVDGEKGGERSDSANDEC
jgi:hypothetical protein